MNALEKALDAGMEPKRLSIAAHEVGHGVGFVEAQCRPELLAFETTLFGRLKGGYNRLGDEHDEPPSWKIPAFLTALMAGHAADARFAHRYFGMSSEDAYEWAADSARDDYAAFDRYRATYRVRCSTETAYARAEQLVARHGDRIDRLTLRMAKRGRLSGSAL